MRLNLTKVILDEESVIDAEVPVELDRIDTGAGVYPVTPDGPALIRVTKDEKKFLNIHGSVALTVTAPCDRCLSDVKFPLELEFDERIPAGGEEPAASASDPSVEDGEEGSAFEPDYYLQGYNLDVDKLLFGEALLNWPSRVLCREDCKGLCPVCGQNLNNGDCGCVRKALDPQMSKVLDIFSKFKEV